ncbi:MAG TPA: nucleotide disphospho-sugar-binding domain-containing protein [Tepidisphaeraceae bacterium]|nr:nucleotide disphospho-sugar-binding domain-containing protein [Tepidisphaeraceae bacterium]
MHAILTSLGTDGDIIPYVALGACLRRRGHRVTLVVAEDFCDGGEFDLEFIPLCSRGENHELLSHPDFWHPLKGAQVGARWGVKRLVPQYELFAELSGSADAVLIASPALLAARVVHDKLGTPIATPILQPWMIKSSIAPPAMPAGLTLPRWAPRPMKSAYWRLIDSVVGMLLGGELNRLRASLGLPPVHRMFEWWMSPQLILGMFPDWYGLPQADWAPQIKLCGFPLFDGRATSELPAEVEDFCKSGAPPIAFTFGTGMMHGAHLFRMAIEACRVLGARGILLTRHTGQLPAELPPFMLQCAFAPFGKLFPLCQAVVHHGGIGTIARALAAGTPQLVMPIAYDQLDNARRVSRLGAGTYLKPRHATAGKIAGAVRSLLGAEVKEQCKAISSRLAQGVAIERAADAVCALAGAAQADRA